MPEEGVEGAEIPQGPEQIGRSEFSKLATILTQRDADGLNVVGWGGDTQTLKATVESQELLPASAFVIVGKGVETYQRKPGGAVMDDPNAMRAFAQALDGGAEIIPQALEMSDVQIREQLKHYFEAKGIVFDDKTELQPFLQAQVKKIKDKANAWEAANS